MTIEPKTIVLLAGVTAIAVGVAGPKLKKELEWQKKRRKYAQRRVEIFQCIQNAEARIQAAFRDENLTSIERRRIMNEEKKFVGIVQNQPI